MNFDINKVNKKIVIFFAITSFFLSFVSGLIANNSFINLFFSSLISALLISILIVIIHFVIANYLPELLETDESDESEDSNFDDGSVNIVMPEEQYTVQGDVSDLNDDSSFSKPSDETDNSGFKEVDLDNLKSLSSTDVSNMSYNDNTEDSSTDIPSYSIGSKGDTEIGKHSVEEMTKAVKTVLKKD